MDTYRQPISSAMNLFLIAHDHVTNSSQIMRCCSNSIFFAKILEFKTERSLPQSYSVSSKSKLQLWKGKNTHIQNTFRLGCQLLSCNFFCDYQWFTTSIISSAFFFLYVQNSREKSYDSNYEPHYLMFFNTFQRPIRSFLRCRISVWMTSHHLSKKLPLQGIRPKNVRIETKVQILCGYQIH